MNSSHPSRPRAHRVWFEQETLCVELADGRVVMVSSKPYPRLLDATKEQRDTWEMIGAGVGIHWPQIDEDLSTEGLLRDAIRVLPAQQLEAI